MTQIIEAVEDSPTDSGASKSRHKSEPNVSSPNQSATTQQMMANVIKAKAICTLTNSGYTAFQISAWRPSAHILVFTSNKRILTQLNLLWGVKSFYYDKYVSTDDTVTDINQNGARPRFCRQRRFLNQPGRNACSR